PLLASAQAGELIFGEMIVEYESVVEKDGVALYYQGESMVVSDHGDLWVVYKGDEEVLEAYDTTNDGRPDTYVTLNSAGEVEEIVGAGADSFSAPAVIEFSELLKEVEEEGGVEEASVPEDDLVGDLDSIKIPKYHNYGFYVFTIVFIAGAYWWYRRHED
ncbi:MAG: hypothetical protein LR008_03040, partial [Candidatus Pacebacteria bacterium]|nr:hypothetical protein [Candidatus Paceibacterota bacterium]